ncbi:hypothetical protein N7474_006073 [Penicillium riverlandense]|uniref:uncharacterized protein n=1 Tax=Penicillium riverlandense TaxID=1903569 RepID=UPI0025475B99|nr:uncharacterized protein N7474_006073 [Penicillium riverlandense]KAJ5820482.1 hypothetical protein N7474_006073 [Penicillium riverlandense]
MRAIGLERDSSDTVVGIMKATRKGGIVALIGNFFFTTHDFPIGPMMQKALTVRGGQAAPRRYQPFLLDLVVEGRLDPSWLFTYEDEFENIAEHYHRFARHEMPGRLKVCLVTAFGRSERVQANRDLVIDRDGKS